MPFLLETGNEIIAYLNLLETIHKEGFKSSRYKEVLNGLLSIDYHENSFKQFIEFKDIYLASVGKTAQSCWKRAERVYTMENDRLTKPSYLKRLKKYPEIYNKKFIEIDQIQNIINELSLKPKYSILTFTFFRPLDLIIKKRPGYVPCPVIGDFKFRKKQLHLNVFFRSHDALNFAYPDIFFLRKLQIQVLKEAKELTNSIYLKKGKVGTLNLHFSRVFIPLSMEMKKGEYLKAKDIKLMYNSLTKHLRSYSKTL